MFALFKQTYIDSGRNFLAETNEAPDQEFLGTAFARRITNALRTMEREPDVADIAQRVAAARVTVKSFVIYQLSNVHPPNGSGIGCGFYDEDGVTDGKGIAKLMNDYVFCTCFNPERQESNISLFLDHCLSHLSNPALLGRDEGGLVATESELSGGLDPRAMGRYWRKNHVHIRNYALNTRERRVFTPNYTASYHDDLKSVFAVLDKLAEELPTE